MALSSGRQDFSVLGGMKVCLLTPEGDRRGRGLKVGVGLKRFRVWGLEFQVVGSRGGSRNCKLSLQGCQTEKLFPCLGYPQSQ